MITRILLCCREPILARGIETVLRQTKEFEVLPSRSAPIGLIQNLVDDTPDVLLLDLTQEVTFTLLSEIRYTLPDMKVVLWANAVSIEAACHAMGLGIRGILRKSLPADLQMMCLRKVQAGELWFEKVHIGTSQETRPPKLTARDHQILGLLAQGLKNREIAAEMSIAEGSVKAILFRLFQKVGVKDRFELALYALKHRPAAADAAGGNSREKTPASDAREEALARFAAAMTASL